MCWSSPLLPADWLMDAADLAEAMAKARVQIRPLMTRDVTLCTFLASGLTMREALAVTVATIPWRRLDPKTHGYVHRWLRHRAEMGIAPKDSSVPVLCTTRGTRWSRVEANRRFGLLERRWGLTRTGLRDEGLRRLVWGGAERVTA